MRYGTKAADVTPDPFPGGAGLPASEVSRRSTSYDWLTAGDGVLRWVESTPATGRNVLITWYADGREPDGFGFPAASVGSALHAYGGTPHAATSDSLTYLVNSADGQVWGPGPTAWTDSRHTYGDLANAEHELLCVREDDDGDELVAIDRDSRSVRVLHRTDGFLASPRLMTGRLAWVQWDRTTMPWDSSEIWVADCGPGGTLTGSARIAGGPGESATQPQWGPDGSLYFMSDRTGWWNLYAWREGVTVPVAPITAECAAPPWESGYATYAFLPGHRIGVIVQDGPHHRLVIVEPGGATSEVELEYTSIKPYVAALGDRIALIGSSPTRPQEIALVSTTGKHDTRVIRGGRTSAEGGGAVSVPRVLRVASAGVEVSVLLYGPSHDVHGPAPLIVRAHSGPTYHSELRLDWEVQFFTSRGFAVADVDYRGSTGYGRTFRNLLYGRWGTVDVEDCRNVALHLLDTGHAMPGAVFISGASAGGYTALRAVCEEGPFSAAAARSAIVDPNRWIVTAPRFQRPHAAALAHETATIDPDAVRERVLLIHGTADDVAPIEDAADLAEALRHRGKPVEMLTLDGVGHYLSAPNATAAALEAELEMYRTVLTDLAERS
jgi:dipeptidyl aminopeptidase/acylaminoacyl peptidase